MGVEDTMPVAQSRVFLHTVQEGEFRVSTLVVLSCIKLGRGFDGCLYGDNYSVKRSQQTLVGSENTMNRLFHISYLVHFSNAYSYSYKFHNFLWKQHKFL